MLHHTHAPAPLIVFSSLPRWFLSLLAMGTENKFPSSDVTAALASRGFVLQNPFPSYHDERWPPAFIWNSADAGNKMACLKPLWLRVGLKLLKLAGVTHNQAKINHVNREWPCFPSDVIPCSFGQGGCSSFCKCLLSFCQQPLPKEASFKPGC